VNGASPHVIRHASDLRSVAFILLALVAYALQWSGVVRHPALYAGGMYLAFVACIINHNHQHHPTFVRPIHNRLFGFLISLAMGMPATVVIAIHNQNHHAHNNTEKDHSRVSLVRTRWNLLNLLLFPFVVIPCFLASATRRQLINGWRTHTPWRYRQLRLEGLVFYPAMGVLFVLSPLDTLIYVAVPYLFGQWLIVASNHLQHFGCDPNSDYNHSRNCTGRLANWWFFNNGYHTAHHLRPDLHWSELPAFHEAIRSRIDPRLDQRSLVATLWQLYVYPAHTGPLLPLQDGEQSRP
jgi:fatty acid desaturase